MTAIRVRLIVDLFATFICATGALLILGRLSSPVRPYAVLIGLVVGSGWALAGWIRLPDDTAYVATVTVGLGIAIPIAVGVLLVESGWWHPLGDVMTILSIAAVVNAVQSIRDSRQVARL